MKENENSRVEGISDGIIAIAITLLILEIKVPLVNDKEGIPNFWKAILNLWPSLMAYFSTFIFILIGWLNHHSIFKMIDKVSMQFQFANGFLLMIFAYMPFPAALLAKYINTIYAAPAAAFYCFTYVLLNLGYQFVWQAAQKPVYLFNKNITPKTIKKIQQAYNFGGFVYLFATVVALWLPYIGLLLVTLMWIYWAILSYKSKNS